MPLKVCGLLLKILAGAPKIVFDAASGRGERTDHKAKYGEKEKERQVFIADSEGVVGLRKEAVKERDGQQDCQHRGPVSRIPGADGDGQGENGHFHVARLIVFPQQPQPKRDCDAND